MTAPDKPTAEPRERFDRPSITSMRLRPVRKLAMARLLYASVLSLGVHFCTLSAHAQDGTCFPRTDLLASLIDHFHQTQVAIGLSAAGVVEVFASPDGATWTLIVSRPDGVSCIVGGGRKWQAVPAAGESL